ncbi:MAG TPA: FAD-binding oxidoreductase [Acidobacteriota bacterium]|nr:FAD-binding oxidoreductase [Acidobacteriota bacterium]
MHLDEAKLGQLRTSLQGELLTAGDPGYEGARRIWNARLDRRPAAIARCANATDVQSAVDWARKNGIPAAVRGGGHDFSGHSVCEGGLVIDLSHLTAVKVYPDRRVVSVGGGATWGAVDQATQAYGLATTGGTVSTVGVAGYALGGGTGHLTRRFGLGLDNLLSVEIVTADGKLRKADQDEHSDLFWAVRGGSGNFGVVTAFQFRLHEVGPEVLAGQTIYALEDAAQVLPSYSRFMAQAPDELQCYAFIVPIPPLDVFPEDLHGHPALDLVTVYSGPPSHGEEIIRPLRTVSKPILDDVGVRSYVEAQTMFDAGAAKGNRWYSKAHYLDGLSDEAIETALSHARDLHGEFTMVYFEPLGGAVARVDPSETSFSHRDAAYSFHVLTGWASPERDDANMAWTRDFHQAMAPHARGGVYVNLLSPDESERIPEAYGSSYPKLSRLKARFDPGNLFRFNHNVPPKRIT